MHFCDCLLHYAPTADCGRGHCHCPAVSAEWNQKKKKSGQLMASKCRNDWPPDYGILSVSLHCLGPTDPHCHCLLSNGLLAIAIASAGILGLQFELDLRRTGFRKQFGSQSVHPAQKKVTPL